MVSEVLEIKIFLAVGKLSNNFCENFSIRILNFAEGVSTMFLKKEVKNPQNLPFFHYQKLSETPKLKVNVF